METIESSFGETISTSVFKNSAMFLQLFNLVKELTEKNFDLGRARVRNILAIGERLKSRTGLPEPVALALESRFNRLSNRQTVANYLFANAAQ
jgi:hypothetical protein